MEIIDELSKKVQQAARELIDLKKDRQMMQSELDLLRNQVRDHQNIARENDKLKREHEQVRAKLIKLQKKIDKHLLVETALAGSSMGGQDEEHP